jgi:hypothetical protein
MQCWYLSHLRSLDINILHTISGMQEIGVKYHHIESVGHRMCSSYEEDVKPASSQAVNVRAYLASLTFSMWRYWMLTILSVFD